MEGSESNDLSLVPQSVVARGHTGGFVECFFSVTGKLQILKEGGGGDSWGLNFRAPKFSLIETLAENRFFFALKRNTE